MPVSRNERILCTFRQLNHHIRSGHFYRRPLARSYVQAGKYQLSAFQDYRMFRGVGWIGLNPHLAACHPQHAVGKGIITCTRYGKIARILPPGRKGRHQQQIEEKPPVHLPQNSFHVFIDIVIGHCCNEKQQNRNPYNAK